MSNKKRQKVQQKLEGGEDTAVVPLDGHTLTTKQARFVEAFSGGPTAGNATLSSKAAGYSASSAGQIGCALLKLSHICDAIDDTMREAVSIRLNAKSVAAIERILDNPDASDKLKGELAVKVVQFSGLADRVQAEKTRQTGLGGQRLGEMTREKLEQIVAAGALVLKAAAEQEKLLEGSFSAQDSAQHPALLEH
jgi:phage terminase small subunit